MRSTVIQQTLQIVLQKQDQWPRQISNGSIMGCGAFARFNIDRYLPCFFGLGACSYRLCARGRIIHLEIFSTTLFRFCKGCSKLVKRIFDWRMQHLLKITHRNKTYYRSWSFRLIAARNKAQTLQYHNYFSYLLIGCTSTRQTCNRCSTCMHSWMPGMVWHWP